MTRSKAIQYIEKHGILIIFPVKNDRLPQSLWSCFFPRSVMRWEWDEGGDNRVAELWHLREQLSRSGKVVYAKWYKNRATVFSPECFRWVRSILEATPAFAHCSAVARTVFGIIADNSPISTKELKKEGKRGFGLAGPVIEKSMKELWQRLSIVGFGEVDDGAFPSLAVGAADLHFEDWVAEAKELDSQKSRQLLEKKLGAGNPFLKELDRIVKSLQVEIVAKKALTSPRTKQKTLTYDDLIGK